MPNQSNPTERPHSLPVRRIAGAGLLLAGALLLGVAGEQLAELGRRLDCTPISSGLEFVHRSEEGTRGDWRLPPTYDPKHGYIVLGSIVQPGAAIPGSIGLSMFQQPQVTVCSSPNEADRFLREDLRMPRSWPQLRDDIERGLRRITGEEPTFGGDNP